jgi:hypothetical protein
LPRHHPRHIDPGDVLDPVLVFEVAVSLGASHIFDNDICETQFTRKSGEQSAVSEATVAAVLVLHFHAAFHNYDINDLFLSISLPTKLSEVAVQPKSIGNV